MNYSLVLVTVILIRQQQIYLFIMRIVHEAQKHSTVQYKSRPKIKQEKNHMHCIKKELGLNYLGRHYVDNRLNQYVAKVLDK